MHLIDSSGFVEDELPYPATLGLTAEFVELANAACLTLLALRGSCSFGCLRVLTAPDIK